MRWTRYNLVDGQIGWKEVLVWTNKDLTPIFENGKQGDEVQMCVVDGIPFRMKKHRFVERYVPDLTEAVNDAPHQVRLQTGDQREYPRAS